METQRHTFQLKMYSPLEVYMKELLRGFCGPCSLKDDNPRLESVAHVTSIIMGNGEYPKDSLITNPHCSFQGTNLVSPTTSCIRPTDIESGRVLGGTTEAAAKCGCDANTNAVSNENASKSQNSSEQTMRRVGSKDDMTIVVPRVRSELGGSNNIIIASRLKKPNLRRSSSLPIEPGELERNSTKQNFFGVVEPSKCIVIKNEDGSTSNSSSKKLRGVKVNWQDMNPSPNQGKRAYSNPRKLLDSTSEYAGSAPPSRPERKMSTESDDALPSVSQDHPVQVSSEGMLPANEKKAETAFPMYKQSLVSCLAQDFQTRPPSNCSDLSIIDSVNNLWSASKDLGQEVTSVSLLSMAKSGNGPLSNLTHSKDSGQTDVGQGKDDV